MLKSPFQGCSIKCMYVCMYVCMYICMYAYNTVITQEIMIKHIASELLTTLLDASGFSKSRLLSSVLLLP